MATRTITGKVLHADGTAWSGGVVRFKLLADTFTVSPAETFPIDQVPVATASDGSFSVALASGLSSSYQVTMPDNETFNINVPAGGSTTLETLRAQYSGTPIAVPPDIQTLLDPVFVNVAGDTMTGNLQRYATSGIPVISILSQQVAGYAPATFELSRWGGTGNAATPSNELVGRIAYSGLNSNGTYASFVELQVVMTGANAPAGGKGQLSVVTNRGDGTAIVPFIFNGDGNYLHRTSYAFAYEGEMYSNDSAGYRATFRKSRHTVFGNHAVVQNGDVLFDLFVNGSDGSAMRDAAVMRAVVDGTPGASDMPGAWEFYTTPDGSVSTQRRLRIDNAGRVLAQAPLGGIGYMTGAGGTISQSSSKSTGVTLNKVTGQITMNAAALAANTTVSFVLTNSAIAAGDQLVINHISGGTFGSYAFNARSASGSATIDVRNISAGSLSEAIVISYSVFKAVTS